MAPAEIWQGGKVINKLTWRQHNKHEGTLQGKRVIVRGTPVGLEIVAIQLDGSEGREMIKRGKPGDSVTLDGGEVAKAVEK